MNIYINGSNREKNCFNILNDLKDKDAQIISMVNKNIKFCIGCNKCKSKLKKLCVLDDYITREVYLKILQADNIIIASPVYMSNISGILKNLIDRFNPLYNHGLLKNKKIFLVLVGQGSEDDNIEEINDIIKWLKGISEWIPFDFEFLKYFSSGDIENIDDVKKSNKDYYKEIENIKYKLNCYVNSSKNRGENNE